MKQAFAVLGATLLIAAASCLAEEEDDLPFDRGETTEPYSTLSDGFKLSFAQLDLQYFGRRCSVYFRSGQPTTSVGIGMLPRYERKDGINILNGEFVGLAQHQIEIVRYGSGGGGPQVTISDAEIDYIIIEIKSPEPIPFVFYQPMASPDFGAPAVGAPDQPYGAISGRDVAFLKLTKNDLNLRCTVYLKQMPSRFLSEAAPKGLVSNRKKTVIVNGELDELGKRFLIVGWADHAKHYFDPAYIAQSDIDHVALEKE